MSTLIKHYQYLYISARGIVLNSINPLSIGPFLDTSLKIKLLLFLNPFDCRHNPGLFWKVTLGVCFPRVRITPNITEVTELEKLKHRDFSPTEKMFCFWLNTDYFSCGHKTVQIPFQILEQYHQKFGFNTFYPEKSLTCHFPKPLCPKLPLLVATLRQQQVEKIIKIRTIITIIISCILIYKLRSTYLGFCQIANAHQQVKLYWK